MNNIKKFNEEFERRGELMVYYFSPNDYDQEYIVMATSQEEALSFVVKGIEKEAQTKSYWESELESWKNATPEKLPGKYTLSIHGRGDLIITEIS